jgi:hypothetical protein
VDGEAEAALMGARDAGTPRDLRHLARRAEVVVHANLEQVGFEIGH